MAKPIPCRTRAGGATVMARQRDMKWFFGAHTRTHTITPPNIYIRETNMLYGGEYIIISVFQSIRPHHNPCCFFAMTMRIANMDRTHGGTECVHRICSEHSVYICIARGPKSKHHYHHHHQSRESYAHLYYDVLCLRISYAVCT